MNATDNRNTVLQTLTRGFIVLLPLVLIIAIFAVLFDFVFDFISPIGRLVTPGETEPHWIIHVLTLLILFLIMLLLGKAVETKRGKHILKSVENNVLRKIPLYSTISDIVYQFSGLRDMPFSKVVLIDPFKTGSYLTGFVAEEEFEDIVTVFVPTAPNPTNGNIFHVPREDAKFIDITPQQAMQTIIGMGTGTSKLFNHIKNDTSDNS
ncbi:MAG: DUF502 domain-containing protein [Cyclobacteriaceae bacterium]